MKLESSQHDKYSVKLNYIGLVQDGSWRLIHKFELYQIYEEIIISEFVMIQRLRELCTSSELGIVEILKQELLGICWCCRELEGHEDKKLEDGSNGQTRLEVEIGGQGLIWAITHHHM